MRKSNTQSLSSVLKSYVQENNLERKLNELDLIKSWESVMGKTVSRYTNKLYIQNNTLFVETNSPVVRNELLMMKEEIRVRLNEVAGEELIKQIIFRYWMVMLETHGCASLWYCF
jgi:predicted nucleic acid-binding Zn ribbon protein